MDPGILLAVAAAALILLKGPLRKRRRRRRNRTRAAGVVPFRRPARASRAPAPGSILTGKAYVTDGDGVRVNGREVRFAGLDAPEWDQWARHEDGYWFRHGKRVKSALIQEIGGKRVRVTVQDVDRYSRAVGIVSADGRDIGEWLVREGLAIAAYGEEYKAVEAEARAARRGMWGHARTFDPRAWRRRKAARA